MKISIFAITIIISTVLNFNNKMAFAEDLNAVRVLDRLESAAQMLRESCSAPSVHNAATAESKIKSDKIEDILPQNYRDEMGEVLTIKNPDARVEQFFQQNIQEGRPTLSPKEYQKAIVNGYGISFAEPVCEAVKSGGRFSAQALSSNNVKCKYYPYAHRQITTLQCGQNELSKVADIYTTHVRSPRLKKHEWVYYEHDENGKIIKKSTWQENENTELGKMVADKPYQITKCLDTGIATVCNSFRYKLVKLDDSTFALITVANNPEDKNCKVKDKNVASSWNRKYVLRGYTGVTLIKKTEDHCVITDVGDGYSTDPVIIDKLKSADNSQLIADTQRYDYEALSYRLKNFIPRSYSSPSSLASSSAPAAAGRRSISSSRGER